MARPPKGPRSNAPRDLRDDFVGVPPEELPDGPPMRWPPKPKKITKDTFHAKVQGRTSQQRADRSPHYRKGGWVSGASFKRGGITGKEGVEAKESKEDGEFDGTNKRGGNIKKRADGGRLTMAQRKALPSKSFALPGKGAGPSGKGAGSYPIPDESHARNALARVSQHGSSAAKATVRAKVHAKFPGIGQKKK